MFIGIKTWHAKYANGVQFVLIMVYRDKLSLFFSFLLFLFSFCLFLAN